MAEEPTIEELLDRIRHLESLVTTEPKEHEGPQYSFPTKRDGMSQLEYQLTNLPIGNGIIHRGKTPYYLEDMPGGESETNAENALVIKVDSGTDIAESVIGGFYHRLSRDYVMEFPPVTRDTTYYACITYDPRELDREGGPMSIERYDEEPPSENGLQHITIGTVERKPNQLLSDAKRTRFRQFVSPVISVQNYNQLPDPEDVLYGTIAVMNVINHATPGMYQAQGSKWENLLVGNWIDVFQGNRNGWRPASNTAARITPSGVQLRGQFNRGGNDNSTFARIMNESFRPNRTQRIAIGSSGSTTSTLTIRPDGDMVFASGFGGSFIPVDGIIYPLD